MSAVLTKSDCSLLPLLKLFSSEVGWRYVKSVLSKLSLLSILNELCVFSELKAEVEKLRAAQMSSQGIEPERVRLFQQEISTLRNKLCQQEREMAEANRSVAL